MQQNEAYISRADTDCKRKELCKLSINKTNMTPVLQLLANSVYPDWSPVHMQQNAASQFIQGRIFYNWHQTEQMTMMPLKFNMVLSKGILRTVPNSVDPDQMLQYQTRIFFCKMYKKCLTPQRNGSVQIRHFWDIGKQCRPRSDAAELVEVSGLVRSLLFETT